MGLLKKSVNGQKEVHFLNNEFRVIKGDCKNGVFLPIGAKEKSEGTPEIKMQIIGWVVYPNAVLFPHNEKKQERRSWVEVMWINEVGIACSTLFFEGSAINFREIELAWRCKGTDIDISDAIVTATMKSFTTKEGYTVFKVVFTAVPMTDKEDASSDFHRNARFVDAMGNKMICVRTLKEYAVRNVQGCNEDNYIDFLPKALEQIGELEMAALQGQKLIA